MEKMTPDGKLIERLRKNLGLSREELCDKVLGLGGKLGVRKLTAIENNENSLEETKTSTIQCIAAVLGIAVESLDRSRTPPEAALANIGLTAFGYSVPDMSLEAPFFNEPDGYIRSMMHCELIGKQNDDLPQDLFRYRNVLKDLKGEFFRRRRELAQKNCSRFSDDPSYALHSVEIGLHSMRPDRKFDSDNQHKRITNYEFKFVSTTYFSFLWPNTVLDDSLNIDDQPTTLRSLFGLADLRMEDLPDKQHISFRVGTGTILITKDNQVVVPLRTRRNEIAPSGYHASLAEGMLITDVDNNHHPSPFETCYRAFEKELGVKRDEHYDPDDVKCIAFLFDQKRCQPYFVFYLRSKTLTFADVVECWKTAEDRSENAWLANVTWTAENAKQLVTGNLIVHRYAQTGTAPIISKQIEVASNHAQACFAVAARFDFPTKT